MIRRPRALSTGLVGAAILLGAAGPATPPLRALRWLAPGADRVAAMTVAPTECLRPPADPDAAWRVEVGRAAFRTPLLLGGQAARAGLTCEACHRSGRGNPEFHFEGVSGAPGTADVTSSILSSHRGDGVNNPRPIPDLSGPRDALRISQAPEGRALEGFISGLVTEEFDGAPPPPAVLDGLAAYVRALSPQACPRVAVHPVRVADETETARRAVIAARGALSRGDRPTAVLMLGAARSALGRIDERFAAPALAPERARLRAVDLEISAVLARIRQGEPADETLVLLAVQTRRLGEGLARRQPLSLFSAPRLAAALRSAGPEAPR